jgi:cytochrome c biogenesis protein CcdA
MLLTTFTTLSLVFFALIAFPNLVSEDYRILALIGSLGIIFLGLTMVQDTRGLVVESGEITTIDNKTAGETTQTSTTSYEEISPLLTRLLELSMLIGGLGLLYTQYVRFFRRENESFLPTRL